jgi:arginine decarboxylase
MRYLDHLARWLDSDGMLNDFLSLRDGRIMLANTIDLLELVGQFGSPLEISFCPLITRRVHSMQQYFNDAAQRSGYRGGFVYAYATKANFAEEVVRTAVAAGAHYETSSAFDVRIAHQLWQNGTLPSDRFVFCNGSKELPYIDAILQMRLAGFKNIVPILDDFEEFEAFASCPEPLLLGVRERKDPGDLAAGITYGYDRFGLLPGEMLTLADRVMQTPHRIIVYHAMVGSQLENYDLFSSEILESLQGYTQLHAHIPSLEFFNFGGGMPTGAYSLDFSFDYQQFVELLMRDMIAWCSAHDLQHPQLVGEFGRYTCADHGVHVFQLGRMKRGHPGMPPWYLLNGSLMVALPDILIVENQEFIVLPLNHLNSELVPVVLGGRRTCDSDDFYPRTSDAPLLLPEMTAVEDGEPLLIAFFGTGAYQAMLSGEGGAHHCLAPEASKVIFEQVDGALQTRVIGEQSWKNVIADLGYR